MPLRGPPSAQPHPRPAAQEDSCPGFPISSVQNLRSESSANGKLVLNEHSVQQPTFRKFTESHEFSAAWVCISLEARGHVVRLQRVVEMQVVVYTSRFVRGILAQAP